MDGTVIFCADGKLRFKSEVDEVYSIQMTLIQKELGLESYPFFVRNLRQPAMIERGSTIATFLKCVEPWVDVVSDITDRDVGSYLAEIRKPSDLFPVFDRCEISRKISISREMVHDPLPEGEDFLQWISRPRGPIQWSNEFEGERVLDCCGYIDGDASNYSMSTNIHKLKNVPLVLNRRSHILIYDRSENPIVVADAAGVQQLPERSNLYHLTGKSDEVFTVQDLLEAVIEVGLWFHTPAGAIGLSEMLAEANEAIQSDEDNVTDTKPVLHLVSDDVDIEETDPPKVVVAPGAFDGIASHYDMERAKWDALKDAIFSGTREPIRISPIVEDVPSDNRVAGLILE